MQYDVSGILIPHKVDYDNDISELLTKSLLAVKRMSLYSKRMFSES